MQRRGRLRDGHRVTADPLPAGGIDCLHRVSQGTPRHSRDHRHLVSAPAERLRAAVRLLPFADQRELAADAGAEREQPAGRVDARAVDAGEGHRLRDSSGGDDDALGDDGKQPVAAADGEKRVPRDRRVVRVQADALGIEEQLGPSCIGIDRRAEEQLRATSAPLPLDQQRSSSGRSGSREPGGSRTDDDELDHAQLAASGAFRRLGELPQAGEPPRDLQRHAPEEPRAHHQVVVVEPVRKEEVRRAEQIVLHPERSILPLAAHAFRDTHAAGGQARQPVDPHQALPAGPGKAERPAWPVVLDRARERGHAGAQQRRGDGVLRLRFDGSAVQVDPRHPTRHQNTKCLPFCRRE